MSACTLSHSKSKVALTKNANKIDIVQTMMGIEKTIKKLQNGIEKQKSKDRVLNHLSQLRNALNNLRGLKPIRGEKELFQQYCEANLGVLLSLEDSLKYSYWPAAQSTFIQLKKLHKDMDKDFGPNAWERFKFWLRNLFYAESNPNEK